MSEENLIKRIEKIEKLDVYYRLERLESRYDNFAKFQHPKLLQERLDKLEGEFKEISNNSKIYAHPIQAQIWQLNINKRLDNLEKNFSPEELSRRIDSLKEINESLKEKIDTLENELNTVRALGSRAFYPKKPHKCPVCEGNPLQMLNIKLTRSENGNDKLLIDCHACEGKGIIWG